MKNTTLFWYQLRVMLRFRCVHIMSGTNPGMVVNGRLFIANNERNLWDWAYHELIKGEADYAPKEVRLACAAGAWLEGRQSNVTAISVKGIEYEGTFRAPGAARSVLRGRS